MMRKSTSTSSDSFFHPWKLLHQTRSSGADSAVPVAQSKLRFQPCQLTPAMLGGVTSRFMGHRGEGLLRAACLLCGGRMGPRLLTQRQCGRRADWLDPCSVAALGTPNHTSNLPAALPRLAPRNTAHPPRWPNHRIRPRRHWPPAVPAAK